MDDKQKATLVKLFCSLEGRTKLAKALTTSLQKQLHKHRPPVFENVRVEPFEAVFTSSTEEHQETLACALLRYVTRTKEDLRHKEEELVNTHGPIVELSPLLVEPWDSQNEVGLRVSIIWGVPNG
jgi:hypothetical protein